MGRCGWKDGIASYLGMNAEGHVNFGNNIIHPNVDGNRESYIEFHSSGEKLGLQI